MNNKGSLLMYGYCTLHKGGLQPTDFCFLSLEETRRGCGQTEIQGSHPGQLLHWLLIAAVFSVDISKTENFKEGLQKRIIWEFISLLLISKPQPGYKLSSSVYLHGY